MRPVPLLALSSALAAFLIGGCTLNTDYFKEYRGTNLLSAWNFGDHDPQHPANLGWQTSVDPAFVTWQTTTDVSAPPEGGPVYRLEANNLIPDGDFEAEPAPSTVFIGPTNWTATGSSSTNFAVNHSHGTGVTLTGTSLWWQAQNSGETLTLDLTAATNSWPALSPPLWPQSPKYRLRINYVNTGTNGQVPLSLLEDSTGAWFLTRDNDSPLSPREFSDSFLEGTQRTLVIGATGSFSAILDNVRLVPDDGDVPLSVKATLPSLDSTSLRLLPGSKVGMYTFSFQVHEDPQAGANNHFAAKAVTVRLVAKVKSGTGHPDPTVIRNDGTWNQWTTIETKFGFDFVNADGDQTGPALTIEIFPCDIRDGNLGGVDTGTILVANPVLTFNP